MNYKNTIFALLSLILALLFYILMLHLKLDRVAPNTRMFTDSTQATITSQKQRIMDLEEAVRLGVIEKSHLIDKVTQQSRIKAETIIVEKKIPIHTEKVIIIDAATMDTTNYVKVPFDIVERDSWYTIIGHVDTSYFTLDTLKVNNKISITVGEHKGKWWQKNKPMVEVKSSNPYTQIELDNVTIEQKKKFWQKPLFGVLIGAMGMFLLL